MWAGGETLEHPGDYKKRVRAQLTRATHMTVKAEPKVKPKREPKVSKKVLKRTKIKYAQFEVKS